MEINVTCEYGYKELCEALLLAPAKLKSMVVTGIVFLICGLSFTLLNNGDGIIFFCGIFITVMALIILVLAILYTPNIKKKLFLKKSMKNNIMFKDGITYNFCFKDDCFTVNSVYGQSNSSSKHAYSDIVRLYANKDFVFLFINKVSCFVIKRSCIGNEELRQIVPKFQDKARKGFRY